MFYVAIKMLVGDRGKFLGIILGISFASLIMTQQPGIFVGIMARSYSFITDIALPDIWVMDPFVKYIDDSNPMPQTMLYRVASVEGVEWAKPLYKGNIQARLKSGVFQTCNVIGIDDATMVGGPATMVQGRLEDLRHMDAIIVNEEGAKDKLAHAPAYPGGPKIPLKIGDTIELNDRRAIVVGIAKTTRTFQSQPVIYTTYTRAITYAPRQRNLLPYILVKIKKGEDVHVVSKRITQATRMSARTAEEFKDLTIQYYLKYTGIPINFGVSVLLGFLVGAAIAGQTFYNFTLENLKYFGVLKAMGTKNRTILRMILLQALLVGCIGYGIGIGCTFLFSLFTHDSLLAFRFTWQLLIFSLVGVTLISILAAMISIGKVIKLEPAIVFKS